VPLSLDDHENSDIDQYIRIMSERTLLAQRTRQEMHLVAKVFGENVELAEILTKVGISNKIVRGGLIVELPSHKSKSSWFNNTFFSIPPELELPHYYDLHINCEESGGGMTNTGFASVCCDRDGIPFVPYYVPTSGHLACRTHAYFSIPASERVTVVVVSASKGDSTLKINSYHLHECVDRTIEIRESIIWKGYFNELPETADRFTRAVNAAMAKVRCYHCREPHFIRR
jgi:hypothetical protein